ncbi:MAG: hypothetical protein ABEI06_09490 [Halobacteriaceae archaeon]
MIVVSTTDFEIYHDVVQELDRRQVDFTTIQTADPIPEQAEVVITGADDELSTDVPTVIADPSDPKRSVEEAILKIRNPQGQTRIGIDPGKQPGIAILVGDLVVSVYHVPVEQATEIVNGEIEQTVDPIVRIGDGARRQGAKLIDNIQGAPIELVDETGTTPHLGTGVRGLDDVLAAINIAQIEGERITDREITPTSGEIQAIKNESRRESEISQTISADLARKVAKGEITLQEALERQTE